MEPSLTESTQSAYVRKTIRFANTVLRSRWLVIALPVIAVALSLTSSLLKARTYTAQAKFMTQGGGARPQASGLAAQLGINVVGSQDATLSPEFYSDLLTSRPIVERTVRAPLHVSLSDTTRRQTLAQHFGSADRALNVVRSGISSGINLRTGVVSFSARASTPVLAKEIAQELLHQLDDFNRQRRKSRISAERQFTEARLAEASAELRTAENALMDFLTRNRGFDRSPELSFAQERLGREVARRQQIYATLAQAHEQAKIDEVRDTPVITVLEEPIPPPGPDSRHTIDRALLSGVLALIFSLIIAFSWDYVRGTHVADMDEMDEMRSHGRAFLRELRHPIKSRQQMIS